MIEIAAKIGLGVTFLGIIFLVITGLIGTYSALRDEGCSPLVSVSLIGALVVGLYLLGNTVSATELTDLSVEYKHSVGTNRSWNIPEGERKRGEVNLNLRVDGAKFYKSMRIKTMFTRQFRYGAYVGEVGYKPSSDVDIFLHHESQHAMDYNWGMKYPNENSVGIRVKLK